MHFRNSKAGGAGTGGAAAGLPRALDLRRTNSYDAINTGCKERYFHDA